VLKHGWFIWNNDTINDLLSNVHFYFRRLNDVTYIIDCDLVFSFDGLNTFNPIYQLLLFLLNPKFLFWNALSHDIILLITTFDVYFGPSICNHLLLQHLTIHQFTWFVSTNDFSHCLNCNIRRWFDLSNKWIISSTITV